MIKGTECAAADAYVDTAALDSLTLEEVLYAGRTQRDLGHQQTAIAIFRHIRTLFPESAQAAYLLGTSLLDANNGEGLKHLKHAMAQDETATGAACAQAIIFLHNNGDRDALTGYRNRLAAWQDTNAEALRVREEIIPDDTLLPPSGEKHQRMSDALTRMTCGLSCAYLVSKVMPEWYDGPVDWLIVQQRGMTFAGPDDHVIKTIENTLSEHGFGEVRVRLLPHDDTKLLTVLRQIEGACLWDHIARSSQIVRTVGE